MAEFDVDLFVIGAGSGGTRAARIAAGHGARAMIAEEDRIGGTCVIRGCVPKKLFVYASRFADEFEDAAGFGWSVGKPEFDWPTLRDAVAREVTRLSGLYRKGLDGAGVAIREERAVVTGPHQVRLQKSGETIRARHILVATKEEAEAVIKELEGGAKFEDLAKSKSTDPAAQNGGDLGYFTATEMVKPFADAAFALLKKTSQESNVKLSRIAENVVALTHPGTKPNQ